MRLCHKIPLLLRLYNFDLSMPEDSMYELTIISKKDNSLYTFQDKTWGKVVHQAFMFMNKTMKQEAKKRNAMLVLLFKIYSLSMCLKYFCI